MTARTHRLPLLAASLGFAGVAAVVVFAGSGSGDYQVAAPVAGDNAGPALSAIAHGHLAALAAHQPLMGLVSLALRAPIVLLAAGVGIGDGVTYRLGALVCLLPLVFVSGLLLTIPSGRVRDRMPALFGGLLAIAGPPTVAAVKIGHPEEVLAITLATAAVVVALADQPLAAAILLGLAVGTKPWGVLAAAPVAVALPEARVRVLKRAALVALPCVVLLPLVDPSAFIRAGRGVGGTHLIAPLSLWWPFGSSHGTGAGALMTDHWLPFGLDRSLASALALTTALTALVLLARHAARRGRQLDPLALLALLGLVRCAADPVPLEYNLLAALIPLVAWEVVELGRLPLAGAIAMLVAPLLFGGRLHVSPGLTNALTVAFVLTIGGYLARNAFHRRIRRIRTSPLDHPRPMPPLASGAPA